MKLAGYGRVSTEEEKQLDSLENQLEFFTEFAQTHGYELYRLYADEGISGKQLKNRDQFLQLLEDAQRRLFDVVVVKDVSRFARNTVDLLTSVRKLKALGIEVLFVNNNQRILGESEFIITLLGAMAQEESANLSKRVKFGKLATSKKGRVPPKIFGYDRLDNFTLRVNEEEADTVRRVFSLYIDQGLGGRRIALTLEAEGRRTKCGGAWTAKSVRRILENPIYCGQYHNHKYTVTDFLEGQVERLPPEDQFTHSRPAWAIVTEERFREAQRLLEQRRAQYQSKEPAAGYSGKHLFSTLIRCEHCGRSFCRRAVTYQSTYVYWRCGTNNQYTAARCDNNTILDEGELRQRLGAYLSDLLADQDAAAQQLVTALERGESRRGEPPGDREKALENRRERLRRQQEKYRELYADELMSLEDLRRKLDSLSAALAQVERQLEALVSPPGGPAATPDSTAALEEIRRFLTLEDVSNAELRRVVSSITVNRDGEVKIRLKAPCGDGTHTAL